MTKQISSRHLDFLNDAKNAFEMDPSLYTYRNGAYDDDDTLIALRYGMDRDCVLIYEIDECVANFVQQLNPAPIARASVLNFTIDMDKQLKANDYKGGWKNEFHQDLSVPLMENFNRLRENLFKIPQVRDRREITRRCANIANYAMMIAENEGEPL